MTSIPTSRSKLGQNSLKIDTSSNGHYAILKKSRQGYLRKIVTSNATLSLSYFHQMQSNRQFAKPSSKFHSAADELSNKRYVLSEPRDVYPLDPSVPATSIKYPDFQPWNHSLEEDIVAVGHLQRGYFELPHVTNELLSARSIMHQLLRSKGTLDELSSQLLKAAEIRHNTSKIGTGSYKPPPRVTLTDQKRESWLKDLAQNNIPLRRLARTIPHGVRNKILIEQCILKNIPINRAVWFVRCVGTNELRGLKRKGGSNIEFNWLHEWSLQVVEFMEKLSSEYLKLSDSSEDAVSAWKCKISYFLRFSTNLYIENLIDKDTFKNWINRFCRTCKFFELPLALTILKIFWNDFTKVDYLIKENTETLLLRYNEISSVNLLLDSKSSSISDNKLNDKIKSKLLNELKELIIKSFDQSIDNFIIPNNWTQLRPILKSILVLENPLVRKHYDLINYRNESLMINYSLNRQSENRDTDLVSALDTYGTSVEPKHLLDIIFNQEQWKFNLSLLLNWGVTRYRFELYNIYLIIELLKLLRSQPIPKVSNREIESEIYNIIFCFKDSVQDINMNSLNHLIHELIFIKFFKLSVYIRRLISSGLIYQTDNDHEKRFHVILLDNLKIWDDGQMSMILKNLGSQKTAPYNDLLSTERILNIFQILLDENFKDVDGKEYSFLYKLDVGHRLKISEILESSINNSLEEQSYYTISGEKLSVIIQLFTVLSNPKRCLAIIETILYRQILDLQGLELVFDYLIANSKLVITISNFDKLTTVLFKNFMILKGFNFKLRKFWDSCNRFISDQNLKLEIRNSVHSEHMNVERNFLISLIQSADMTMDPEMFLDLNNFQNNFQTLMKTLSAMVASGRLQRDCILKLLGILKCLNNAEFGKVLFIFIKKTYSSSTDIFKNDLIVDLIVSDLIPIDVIVDFFLGFDNQAYTNFITEMLFSDPNEIKDLHSYRLTLFRDCFKKSRPDIILKIIKNSILENDQKLDSIQNESIGILDSLLPDGNHSQYRSQFLKEFLKNLIRNTDLVIKIFDVDTLQSSSKMVTLLIETLDIVDDHSTSADNLGKIIKCVKRLNRFNTPIVQLLFKFFLSYETPFEEFMQIFKIVIQNIDVHDDNNELVGSLFELLDKPLKVKLIHYLEILFLNSKTFPVVTIDGKEIKANLISDVLISLTRNIENVELSDELIFSLDVTLEIFLKLVNQTIDRLDFEELYDSISLYLKIIIIHKSFLINVLVERNSIKENFLNNLVNLLSSNLTLRNVQLKNLLYDLLLSIKSSINELNANQTTTVKLPVSLLTLPTITQGDLECYATNTQSIRKQQKQNLFDCSITNALYLYSKTNDYFSDFNIKPFDLLEDSNPIENINDTAISLKLFEATIEKQNPS